MRFNENTLIGEVLEIYDLAEEILKKHGLNCVGCPASYNETIKEAAIGHSISLERLLEDLNSELLQKG